MSLTSSETEIARRARHRITRRLLPYLFLLYVIAYLDRVNVSYAALEMTHALGFGPDVYGFGAGIFFVGYFMLEIPGSILVERWSARKWIARIMFTWGIVAIAAGFIETPHQFYWVRFLLGVAEAGFFPGVIVYMGHWFRREERARAMAWFMAAQPVSNIIGAPLSGWLLGIHWLGWPGWRWLFVVEGAPAVVLGVVTLFYLTDRPSEASWLPDAEREWLTAALARERTVIETRRATRSGRLPLQVLLLVAGYFCVVTSIYGFQLWLPTLLQRVSGLSSRATAFLSALPYCVGFVALLVVGWSSDRTGERRWHTVTCVLLIALGLAGSVAFGNSLPLALAMFCVASFGISGYLPVFWMLPTAILTGTAAAATIGLINSVGNLGGFVGPYVVGYLVRTTGSNTAGVLFLSAAAAMSAVLLIAAGGRREPVAIPSAMTATQD